MSLKRVIRSLKENRFKLKTIPNIEESECKITLETSGEDAKIHSKRVEKMRKYTRTEWRRCENRLETSVESQVDFLIEDESSFFDPISALEDEEKELVKKSSMFYTRFECSFSSSPLVSSLFSHLLHSLRVYFYIFSTRFEFIFTSSPLVSSVFFQSKNGLKTLL